MTACCRLLVLVVAAALAGCGAQATSPATPQAGAVPGAVVSIPVPTPEQRRHFDADRRSSPVPGGRSKIARDAHDVAGDSSMDRRVPSRRPGAWVGPSGGPDCVAVELCCERILQHNGAKPSSLSICDSFLYAPDVTCRQLRASFRRASRQSGVRCP